MNPFILWRNIRLSLECAKSEGMSYAVNAFQESVETRGIDVCVAVIDVNGEKFRVTIEKEK